VAGQRRSEPGRHLLLRVAGLSISMTCDADMQLGVAGSKEMFVLQHGVPDVRITAAWAGRLEERTGSLLFDAGSSWQLYWHDGAYLFHFKSLAFGPHPYRSAIFAPDFSAGQVFLDSGFFRASAPVDPLLAPLDELLYSALLARGNGAEMHACGVIDAAGHGRLFVGKSGAGKTTMAKLWQGVGGASILSDDRIILRRQDGTMWMYGTPWHGVGGMACPARAPLSAIYFLEKARTNALAPRAAAGAAADLTACSFPPFYSREAMGRALDFIAQVVASVPCYTLGVVPDHRIVEFLQAHVPSSG
jgi:hypothetical protein